MADNNFPANKQLVTSQYLSDILKPYTGFAVDDSNWKEIKADKIVYFSDNILNRIWKDTTVFRDNYAVDLIKEKLKSNNRIFIMMGADHIKSQKDRLESCLWLRYRSVLSMA